MTPRALRPLFGTFSLLLVLSGCATAPSPFGGAPVEDRSIRRPVTVAPRPQLSPQVEVQPLARPEPLAPSSSGFDATPLPAPGMDGGLPAATVAPMPTPPNSVRLAPPPAVAAAPAAAPVAPSPAPTAPTAAAGPPPAEISRQGNQAVVALLDSAAGFVQSNDLDRAAAALERAQRIEPRNPSILYDLAQVRAHQGQYAQAEALAQKSIGLAGSDTSLKARNWKLISAVRRAGGNASGADAAEAQAVAAGR